MICTIRLDNKKQSYYYIMSRISEILKNYTYNPSRPTVHSHEMVAYDATSKDLGLKFTIKIYKRADAELASYLQKIKSAGSDYLIKIYQIYNEPETHQLLLIQEAVTFGSLANALSKCKRLEEQDAITVSKILLNGHIDLMRNGAFWTGTEADIEITDSGLKLSWNNSITYSENNMSPFGQIISNIALRANSENNILPFPANKMINDLIKVSGQNASEMSLHPLLKKRQKLIKKKGKNWIGIKEYKIKGQYIQELSYTAVSKQHGFVRVKIFENGKVDMNLMKICQTVPNFVKILDYYEEGDNFITISNYANDGNVQNYVKKLKNATIKLKESQIEFIFYSLIDPLKLINKSEVQSLNMLHIKNIYIENGIPKIGQPIPLNQNLNQNLIDRAEVPDFYHKNFKKQPNSKNAYYDTYSLGVLIYKLMYTQYPIFPEGKVHIPTTPAYKKTLRDALLLFLNSQGNIEDVEKQIEVSDDVKNKIQQNQKLLLQQKSGKKGLMFEQEEIQVIKSQVSEQPAMKKQELEEKGYLFRLYYWLSNRGEDENGKYSRLHKTNFAVYRKCTTVSVILIFYFLVFFLAYFIGFFNLIGQTRLFVPMDVYILGQKHVVIVNNYDSFTTEYNSYNNFNSINVLNQKMGCVIDDDGKYYEFVRPNSPHWYIYLIFSFIVMATILVLKGIQLSQFSTARVGYHYYDTTISGANQSRFVLSSYVFFQLWFCMCLYAFFYLFNYIFMEQHSPCFGGDTNQWSELTKVLFKDRMDFSLQYLSILCLVFLFGILSFIQFIGVFDKITYGSLCNPIFIFTPFYLILLIMLRFGAYSPFVPSFASNVQGIIGSSFSNFIGYFPEFLLIVEIPLCLLIQYIYFKCGIKKLESFVINQASK